MLDTSGHAQDKRTEDRIEHSERNRRTGTNIENAKAIALVGILEELSAIRRALERIADER